MSFRNGPVNDADDETENVEQEDVSSEREVEASTEQASSDSEPEPEPEPEVEQLSVDELLESVRMTDKHRAFLRAIHDFDGRAPMSKIKDVTGLSQDEANFRFQKWSDDEHNLIDVEKLSSEESGKPTGERVAVLNERGEQAIRQGLIGDVFDDEEKEVRRVFGKSEVEDFQELQEEVERLESVVSRLQKRVDSGDELPSDSGVPEDIEGELTGMEDNIIKLSDKVGALKQRVERVESDTGLEELDGVEARVSTLENRMDAADEERASLRDDFESFRKKAREHLLNAEAYMKGTRWALEENLNKQLEEALGEKFSIDLGIGDKIRKVRNNNED